MAGELPRMGSHLLPRGRHRRLDLLGHTFEMVPQPLFGPRRIALSDCLDHDLMAGIVFNAASFQIATDLRS